MTIPFLGKRILRPTVEDLEVLLLSSDVEMPPSHGKLVSLIKQYVFAFFLLNLCLTFDNCIKFSIYVVTINPRPDETN